MTEKEEDQITAAIGNWGKWQFKIIMISGVFGIPICWHVLIMTFMNAKVESWCARPAEYRNLPIDEWRNRSGQAISTCHIYDTDWDTWSQDTPEFPADQPVRDCEKWEYDTSVFTSTITGEFDLVCSRSYLVSTAQTLYFFGMIFGVFTFGLLADLYGRKPVIIILLICTSLSGILTSQMPSYPLFVAARVVNAFFVIGIVECNFSFSLELVSGKKWSTLVGLGLDYFWVVGWLTLALLAYFVRSWRVLMLVTSIPTGLAFLLIWLIPESPRWLLATGKIEEAEKVVREAVALNKRSLPPDWRLTSVQLEKARRTNVLDLFRTPNMRWKTLILYYNFFVNSACYYGLSMNTGDLGGDLFINFSISGLLEIPAYGLAIIVLLRHGRRIPYAVSLLLSGVSLICISFVPRGVYHQDWPAVMMAQLGKACITFSFGVLFLFGNELFPTEIRTSGAGSASFIGRLGGMVAPWIGQLSSVHPYLPVNIFGMIALLAGVISFVLPETFGTALPYTIEEAEKLEIQRPWKKPRGQQAPEE